jgi:16S rRNA (adenine1518-N6/adenine1519-N6)-dimethyltransferase
MVNILNQTFENKENFKIQNIDFLKVKIDLLIDEINQKGYKDIVVLSNLPYYITSKLLNKILINNYNIRCIVAMMQKEVGMKLIRPEKKEYNQLSVILDYQYDVSIVKYVGKNSYLPRPEIDSIVLKFEKITPKFAVSFNNLLKVTEALFSARRKTVSNNLKQLGLTNEQIQELLVKVNILSNYHIEQLTTNDIVNIAINI